MGNRSCALSLTEVTDAVSQLSPLVKICLVSPTRHVVLQVFAMHGNEVSFSHTGGFTSALEHESNYKYVTLVGGKPLTPETVFHWW